MATPHIEGLSRQKGKLWIPLKSRLLILLWKPLVHNRGSQIAANHYQPFTWYDENLCPFPTRPGLVGTAAKDSSGSCYALKYPIYYTVYPKKIMTFQKLFMTSDRVSYRIHTEIIRSISNWFMTDVECNRCPGSRKSREERLWICSTNSSRTAAMWTISTPEVHDPANTTKHGMVRSIKTGRQSHPLDNMWSTTSVLMSPRISIGQQRPPIGPSMLTMTISIAHDSFLCSR